MVECLPDGRQGRHIRLKIQWLLWLWGSSWKNSSLKILPGWWNACLTVGREDTLDLKSNGYYGGGGSSWKNSSLKILPGWWNGRHVGLKIQWLLWLWGFKSPSGYHAGIAQLVEHDLAKVGVASSSLVSRSKVKSSISKEVGDFLFKWNCEFHYSLSPIV